MWCIYKAECSETELCSGRSQLSRLLNTLWRAGEHQSDLEVAQDAGQEDGKWGRKAGVEWEEAWECC